MKSDNKKMLLIVSVVVVLLAVSGAAFAYTANKSDSPGDRMMKAEDSMKKDDAMQKDDSAMMDDKMAKYGSEITLADYQKDPAKYAGITKVYFFHASWCPICQGIQKEINADMSKIPAGVVLIKADFDTETKLRQKYGVTYQYTFVQFDNDGNQIKKWSASSLNDIINGIQS